MIKGYFPVSMYAKMNGISTDTAWHRVLREGVESIIGKDGERYVYYEKHTKLEQNYITLKEYGKTHGISNSALYGRIRKGIIPENVLVKKGKGSGCIYIQKDYVTPTRRLVSPKTIGLYQKRPDGYMTVKDWADKNQVSYNTARVYMRDGRIPSIRVGGYRYIPSDFVFVYKCRKKNKALNAE